MPKLIKNFTQKNETAFTSYERSKHNPYLWFQSIYVVDEFNCLRITETCEFRFTKKYVTRKDVLKGFA